MHCWLRSFANFGSSLAVFGAGRFGSVFTLSVLDCLHLGSSLALRSFASVGSGLSVHGVGNIESISSSSCTQKEFVDYQGIQYHYDGHILELEWLFNFGIRFHKLSHAAKMQSRSEIALKFSEICTECGR